MRFIHQHENIIAGRKDGILFALVIAELVNQRKYERLVPLQVFAKLFAVLGLAFILRADDFCPQEVLVYLRIKVFAVGDNKEREVATELTLDLTGKHRHRVTLAAPLRMPEHAQLAIQFLAVLYGVAQVIHTHKLVVLGDNLYRAVLEQDKVFNVVNKRCLVEQTPDHVLRTYALAADMLAVNLVVFAFLEPFKEIVVAGVESAKLCLETVRKHANLVECEKVRNILPVARQILVVRFFNLDGTVFQFDKDERQTVHKYQNIGASEIEPSLDPHLRYSRKGVVFGIVVVDKGDIVKIRLAILDELYADTVTQPFVEHVVGFGDVRAGIVSRQFVRDFIQLVRRNVRIEPRE